MTAPSVIDGSELPHGSAPLAHQFFFGVPAPAPNPFAPPCVPDALPPPPPSVINKIPFFAAPLVTPTPPTPIKPVPLMPAVLPPPPALAHTFQFWTAPGNNSIGNFPGFGPSGAATFVLSLSPGTKCTYSWHTDIFKSYSGQEQRINTTGPYPRQRFEGAAFLLDADTRSVRATMQRAASSGSTFLLALPHEEIITTADSVGTTLTVSTTAQSDWAIVTQRVAVVASDGTATDAVIQAVTSTTLRLDVAPNVKAGARIMPLIQVLLDSTQGFSRYPVNVDTWSIRCMANTFGWVGQDVMGRGAQIATYASGTVAASSITDADLIIFDRVNLIEGTAAESMLSLTEVVDLGALPFSAGAAPVPDWARPIRYSSSASQDFQWLKAFLRLCLGRQRPFALSTNRDDLIFVSAIGSRLRVEDDGDYTSWYASVAHRLLALTKTDGTIQYVGVGSLTDNGDGTLTLGLDAIVTGTVSRISFLEIVRFDNGDSDDFSVTWDGGTFATDLIARTVEETVISPVALPTPKGFLCIGDSIQYGIGVGDQAKQDDPTIGTPITSCQYLHHGALGVGPPPTFTDYPAANTLGPLNLYAASSGESMGFEMTMGPVLAAALPSAPTILVSAVAGSTLATEWDPNGTYPASGSGNLYHGTVTLAHNMEAANGFEVAVIFVVLGTNDALSGTQSAAFAANIANLDSRLASDFPGSKRVYLKVNSATGTGTDPRDPANVTTVRNGLASALSGNANAAIVTYDDCALLADSLHPTTETYLAVGPRIAAAALDLMSAPRAPLHAFGSTGWGVSWGTGTSGSGSLSPHSYDAGRTGGREFCVVTTGIVSGTIPTPSSADAWTQVGSTIASTSSGVTEQMAVFTRPWSSAATTITPTTTARHMAKIFYVEGPNFPTAPTVSASTATTPGTFGTGPDTFGAITLPTNGLALLFPGGYCGSDTTQSATNGTLSGFVKLTDSAFTIVTDREILAAFGGTGTGSSGTFAVSRVHSTVELGFTLALAP